MFIETLSSLPYWFWALLAVYVCVLPAIWLMYRKWLKRQDFRLGVYLNDFVQWRYGAGLAEDKARKLATVTSKIKVRTFKIKEIEKRKPNKKNGGQLSQSENFKSLKASMGWGISRRKALFVPGYGALVRPLGSAGKLIEQLAIQSQSVKKLSTDQIWPQGDHLVEPLAIERHNINEQEQKLSESFETFFNSKEVSCAVQYRGRLLWESYADGLDAHTPQVCKSLTPFVFTTVFGLLSQQRRLKIEQEIPEEGWTKDSRERLQFGHLLKSISGLNEISEKQLADALYGHGQGLYDLVSNLSSKDAIGVKWKETPTNVIALSHLLSLGFGERTDIYRSFLQKNLFGLLNMQKSSIALSADGLLQSYSGLSSTPRDLLRFASLYQNDGFWLGERILPQDWLSFISSPVEASGPFGASVYCQLNSGAKLNKIKKSKRKLHRHGPPYASLPQDSIFVLRDGLSLLVIVPSAKLSLSFISTGKPLPDDGIESFVHLAMTMVQLEKNESLTNTHGGLTDLDEKLDENYVVPPTEQLSEIEDGSRNIAPISESQQNTAEIIQK